MDLALAAGSLLDEVVVIGYGTSKKSDLTGSIATLDSKDFDMGVVTAPDQLIQGKIAGVQMSNNSGMPGGRTTVRISGNSSVRTGSDPLYVVDGVPLDGRTARPSSIQSELGSTESSNPLNFINTLDIASMVILKDASATAIYGSRGANGVVLITTKKPRVGEAQIDFNASVGVSNILQRYDVLTGDEYRAALSQYNLGTSADKGQSINAQDELTRTAFSQIYNVSVGGGSENGTYRVSLGYTDQDGIIQTNNFKKYNASLFGSYKFLESKALGLDINLITSQTKEITVPVSDNNGFTGDVVTQSLQWNPTQPLKIGEQFVRADGATTVNPLEFIDAYDDESNVGSILASIIPSWKITDALTYKFIYSVLQSRGERVTNINGSLNLQGIEDRGLSYVANNVLTTQQLTHTLDWNVDISSNVNFNALIGYEYMDFRFRGSWLAGFDFLTDEVRYSDILQNSSADTRLMASFKDPTTELQSYFARVNFNISDKYLITATFRADGSTKFGENNKYGYFPSVAAAWNMTKEDFMSGGAFDDLRLRLGWGQTGNQNFPSGASQFQFILTNDGGAKRNNVANPDLKWETSTTINAGLDFALFDYRFTGTLDYFNKSTEDLLFNFLAIPPAPDTRYWINLPGKLINSGFELTLDGVLITNEKLTWNLGVNMAFLNNKMTDYDGPTINTGQLFGQGISGVTVQQVANEQPLNVFYMATHTGIGEDGQSILANNGEKSFVGDPNPSTVLGITTTLFFGDWDLGMNFSGAYGYVIYNNTANSVVPIGNLGTRNLDSKLIGPQPQEATSNPIAASTRYLEKGDFLKLGNATIGWNFGNIGNWLKGGRLYITGANLFIITDYTGFDPEVNTVNDVSGVPSFGIEYTSYPSARSFVFGVNFSL
jgi:iron complex outermembrane receptor protein